MEAKITHPSSGGLLQQGTHEKAQDSAFILHLSARRSVYRRCERFRSSQTITLEGSKATARLTLDSLWKSECRPTSLCRPHRARPRTTSASAKTSSLQENLPPHLWYDWSASSDLKWSQTGEKAAHSWCEQLYEACESNTLKTCEVIAYIYSGSTVYTALAKEKCNGFYKGSLPESQHDSEKHRKYLLPSSCPLDMPASAASSTPQQTAYSCRRQSPAPPPPKARPVQL